jgi:8-oxo-dGTP pyrophosphatase MutT (NUDIX family)
MTARDAGPSTDESVALYDPLDEGGREVGSAPRSVVRRDNLPHAATAVLLRRGDGQVLVHRRSDRKDLWPGRHDCAAGGVVLAGEAPLVAAERELVEELGVRGVPLTPLLRAWYRDLDTWYLGFVFDAVWNGPVSFDDGEVAAGWWEPATALRARLADPSWPFVPDTRRLLELLPDWPGPPHGV